MGSEKSETLTMVQLKSKQGVLSKIRELYSIYLFYSLWDLKLNQKHKYTYKGTYFPSLYWTKKGNIHD